MWGDVIKFKKGEEFFFAAVVVWLYSLLKKSFIDVSPVLFSLSRVLAVMAAHLWWISLTGFPYCNDWFIKRWITSHVLKYCELHCVCFHLTSEWTKKLNTWCSLDLLCVVIHLSEDLFLIRKDLLLWLGPCCHEISLCIQYNALCQGLSADLTDLPLTVLGFQSWASLPFFVGSILHLLHDHVFIQIMKTNVLFLSWGVRFWDLRLAGAWVSQGAGIWWLWWLFWMELWCRIWNSLSQDDTECLFTLLVLLSLSKPLGFCSWRGWKAFLSLKRFL